MKLKQNSDNAKTLLLVTIASDPKAPYYRTIDVLNALAAAEISNVTFTVEDGF
jgi:biopolymer transport protein ExbD